jgi:hypothetical protein
VKYVVESGRQLLQLILRAGISSNFNWTLFFCQLRLFFPVEADWQLAHTAGRNLVKFNLIVSPEIITRYHPADCHARVCFGVDL